MIARGAPFGRDPMLTLALILLVLAFLTGGIAAPLRSLATDPNAFVGFVIAIVLGITVHEFMHAYAAHRQGDDTAKALGRLTLDPRAHFDIFGTLLLVLAGFGYGKPVPFNESRLRSTLGVSLVAVAGPLANFAIAAVCAIPLRFDAAAALGPNYEEILFYVVLYNCVLGIFNLLPIPPLDGSNVVYGFLPPRLQYTWRSYSQYGFLILLALLWFGYRLLQAIVFQPAFELTKLLIGL
ncbi:MAG TPA: site-2 protease family protein [Candidatus Limnocylindria bacterium]|nr:site-2 protease family protein [Candidatus Limnocylindria bacterium]